MQAKPAVIISKDEFKVGRTVLISETTGGTVAEEKPHTIKEVSHYAGRIQIENDDYYVLLVDRKVWKRAFPTETGQFEVDHSRLDPTFAITPIPDWHKPTDARPCTAN